ncbi:MAG TPA: alpha/beta fold hydrolase, partial [Prosthecobacter sp.]
MNFRFLRKVFLLLLLLGIAAAIAATFWAGQELASPGRRPLHDYHQEFLQHAAAHGMEIHRFPLADGTPCLMCVPEPGGRLGQRGTTLRSQFAQRHDVQLPPAGSIHATLVLVHGRKGRKEDYLPIAERLCAVGFRCLLPDVPAHGEHPAPQIFYGVKEARLPAQVLEEASRQFGFPPQPCGLLGMSMGGSVAVHASAEPGNPWKALVVISSFHSFLPAMQLQASRLAGSWLGVPWAAGAARVYEWKTGMSLEAVQPHEKAARLAMPTLMLHGTDDRVVPVESGRKLFAALPDKLEKQWVEVPSADHHNVLITEYPVYATVAEWML